MKNMIIIIVVLAIIFIVMLVNRNLAINSGNNVTIQEIENIENYISKIYMWKEITNEALPTFDNINNANELWIWEVVKKNLEEFELKYQQIQEKAKEIFGEDLEKELPKNGNESFIYDDKNDLYYPTEIKLDEKEDLFLLDKIEKIENGYEVTIIEYMEDYSKFQDGENIILIKNINEEEIGQASDQNIEQNVQDIVKRNSNKFTKKKITLKRQNENLYVQKVQLVYDQN